MAIFKHLVSLLAAVSLAAWSTEGSAEQAVDSYPSRTLTLVVPFSAGGVTDAVARTIAGPLGKELGQTVIVENVTGAGGNIGSLRVANAAPDGYTLLITQTSTVTNPLLDKQVKFDAVGSFTPIAYLGSLPFWLLVNPAHTKVGTLKELVARIKASPGKLNYGSGGTGSASHLGVAYFQQIAGLEVVHVPYRGMTAALTDLFAGLTDFSFTPVGGVEGFVSSGKLAALAVTGKDRPPAFPNVPTFAQAGFPQMDVAGWVGISGPKSLPPGIVRKLNVAVNKVVSEPVTRAALLKSTLTAEPVSPEAFDAKVRNEQSRWSKLIKATGIKAD